MNTIENIAPKWVSSKKDYVKNSTIAAYQLLLLNHIIPYWRGVDVKDIKASQGQEYYEYMLSKGLSAKSAKDTLICVNMVLRFASEVLDLKCVSGLCRVKTPKEYIADKEELIVYNPEEQKKIIDYLIDNPSNRGLGVLITMHTGLRIGEVTALQFGDIDIENGVLRVTKTIQRVYEVDIETNKRKTHLQIGKPKTATSLREVPIAKRILPVLKKFKAVSNDDYYVCSGSVKPNEPRTYRNWYTDLIYMQVGLSRCMKFHGLRHTFATTLLAKGVDIKTTSTILGHKNVGTTMNLYMHPSKEDKKKAINKAFAKL